MTERPLPVLDNDSRPFWEGAKARKLMLQQCGACQRHVWYPRALCPHCHADALEWRQVSGEGTIYSYTVARRPAGPAFAEAVPYVIALIDLKEGARMMSNIVTADPDALKIGQAVKVVFEDVTDEIAFPKFEPV